MTARQIILLLFLSSGIVFWLVISFGRGDQSHKLKKAPDFRPLIALPTPTPQIYEVHSADGKMNLVLKVSHNSPAQYALYTSEVSERSQRLIFSQTATGGAELSLPPNAWSPDNKYLFVRQTSSNKLTALVFKADGQSLDNDLTYFDIADLWSQRNMKLTLRDITGWASNNLIILFTSEEDGQPGPPYWFEVPSKAFLQLRD